MFRFDRKPGARNDLYVHSKPEQVARSEPSQKTRSEREQVARSEPSQRLSPNLSSLLGPNRAGSCLGSGAPPEPNKYVRSEQFARSEPGRKLPRFGVLPRRVRTKKFGPEQEQI